MEKIVIVVRGGMVESVYGSGQPYQFEVEILDMDGNGADPDAEALSEERLQTVEQHLCKYL